jgi:GNAT superfamily N-acetyltransferase
MIQIREALPKDAPGIADVHIHSWQTSYRGIVPDEVLDNQSAERRQGYWEQVIAGKESGWEAGRAALHFVFVAEDDQGEIVGFASGGKSRQETLPFQGELYAIYLLEAYKRQGIGEQLFRAVVERFLAEEFRTMMLWVLADNLPGRQFYEKMGGKYVTEQKLTIGGKRLLEVAYGWETLNILDDRLHFIHQEVGCNRSLTNGSRTE